MGKKKIISTKETQKKRQHKPLKMKHQKGKESNELDMLKFKEKIYSLMHKESNKRTSDLFGIFSDSTHKLYSDNLIKYINEEFTYSLINFVNRLITESASFPSEIKNKIDLQKIFLKLTKDLMMNQYEVTIYSLCLDIFTWNNKKYSFIFYLYVLGFFVKELTMGNSDSLFKDEKDCFGVDQNFKNKYLEWKKENEEKIKNITKGINISTVYLRFKKLNRSFNVYCKNDYIDYNVVVQNILYMSLPYEFRNKKGNDFKENNNKNCVIGGLNNGNNIGFGNDLSFGGKGVLNSVKREDTAIGGYTNNQFSLNNIQGTNPYLENVNNNNYSINQNQGYGNNNDLMLYKVNNNEISQENYNNANKNNFNIDNVCSIKENNTLINTNKINSFSTQGSNQNLRSNTAFSPAKLNNNQKNTTVSNLPEKNVKVKKVIFNSINMSQDHQNKNDQLPQENSIKSLNKQIHPYFNVNKSIQLEQNNTPSLQLPPEQNIKILTPTLLPNPNINMAIPQPIKINDYFYVNNQNPLSSYNQLNQNSKVSLNSDLYIPLNNNSAFNNLNNLNLRSKNNLDQVNYLQAGAKHLRFPSVPTIESNNDFDEFNIFNNNSGLSFKENNNDYGLFNLQNQLSLGLKVNQMGSTGSLGYFDGNNNNYKYDILRNNKLINTNDNSLFNISGSFDINNNSLSIDKIGQSLGNFGQNNKKNLISNYNQLLKQEKIQKVNVNEGINNSNN